jgi:hypothetical protein
MHRTRLLSPAAGLAVALGFAAQSVWAQPPRPPAGPNPALVAAQAKPTPKSPWGPPDLTGAWERPGNFGFPPPPPGAQKSNVICVVSCTANVDDIARAMGPTGVQPIASTGPGRPKYKPALMEKVVQLEKDQVKFDPVLKCANPGLPRIGAPDKIVQSAKQVVFLYEDVNGAFWRIVPTDGRAHDPNAETSPLGQSVGRWEGDTLVVVTKSLTDDTWLIDDGAFHTDKLVVTERFRRVGDTLQYEVVSDDPSVLAEPWKRSMTFVWTDKDPPEPLQCSDTTVELIVDGSHHDNPR